MHKKEVIIFRQVIPKATTNPTRVVLSERIKADGVIEEVRARFYTGQQTLLKVRPYVKHKANKMEEFFTYTGDSWLSGDDDYFTFPVAVVVEYDDELVIEVKNESDFDYNLAVDVVISYM